MDITETLVDIFLDDPGFKFIDCYRRIPVFKKLSKADENGRFWFAFSIGDKQVIILGPDTLRLDLTYAVAYLMTRHLKNHFIAYKNEEAAVRASKHKRSPAAGALERFLIHPTLSFTAGRRCIHSIALF